MTTAFPQNPELIYLNHASVGPWPLCTYEAVEKFAKENIERGAQHYPQWLKVEQNLRVLLSKLVNAESTDSIALLKNTSEALSVIAYGLDWQAGDNIVLAADEFPSNRIVWESLQSQGVEVRRVKFDGFNHAEDQLIAATDRNTRLLTSSSVQYASGLRMNLEKLGAHCAQSNILFSVDAIQSLGAFPFDAQAIQADFVVADGHKWMLGPEGLALFYCHPKHLEKLKLYQYGWHMVEHAGDYDRDDWQTARTAKRFECGSPNMLGIHALQASLDLLLNTGIETVAQRISGHVEQLAEQLQAINGVSVISPLDAEKRAGIVTFKLQQHDNAALQQYLMNNSVVCAYRGGGIRFSPHFYHQTEQLERAINVLKTKLAAVD